MTPQEAVNQARKDGAGFYASMDQHNGYDAACDAIEGWLEDDEPGLRDLAKRLALRLSREPGQKREARDALLTDCRAAGLLS